MKHLIEILEFERGWGSSLDEEQLFDTKEEATDWCSQYNKKYNNEPVVPDWYMAAFYVGEVHDNYKCKK